MESLSKRKLVWILLGVGALGLSIYSYFKFFSKRQKHSKNGFSKSNQQPWGSNAANDKSYQSFTRESTYNQSIEKLTAAIQTEKEVGMLSANSLLNINRVMVGLVKREFLVKYKKSRELRRKSITNLTAYAQEYIRGAYEGDQIFEDGLCQVLQDIDLDVELYEHEYQRVSFENSNFVDVMHYLFESIKIELADSGKKNVTVEKLVEMFKFQLEVYDIHDFAQVQGIPADGIITLKQSYIGELASMKFGIEEEDLIRNPEALRDPRIADLQKLLQDKLNLEQQKLINFPF